MRIRVEIGNPETEKWGDSFFIDLVPYSKIFEQEHPDIPPYPGIDDSMGIKDYKIDIHGQSTVAVMVSYYIPQNSISIFVKHNGKSFVQVMGEAFNFDNDGDGLSLLFLAPETNVPVNLTCTLAQ